MDRVPVRPTPKMRYLMLLLFFLCAEGKTN